MLFYLDNFFKKFSIEYVMAVIILILTLELSTLCTFFLPFSTGLIRRNVGETESSVE